MQRHLLTPNTQRPSALRDPRRAFTLLEVLVATGVLAVMVTILFALFAEGSNAWQMGERRADVNQGMRTALGMIARDASLAVIATNNQPPMAGLVVDMETTPKGDSSAAPPTPYGVFEEVCFVAPIEAGNETTNDTYRALCGVRYYVATAPVIPGQQPPVLGNLTRVLYKTDPMGPKGGAFSLYATPWYLQGGHPPDCYTNIAVIAENVLSFRVQPGQYNAQYVMTPYNATMFKDMNSDTPYRIDYKSFGPNFVTAGDIGLNFPGIYVGLCVVDIRTASRINKLGLSTVTKMAGFQATTNWVTVHFENYRLVGQ